MCDSNSGIATPPPPYAAGRHEFEIEEPDQARRNDNRNFWTRFEISYTNYIRKDYRHSALSFLYMILFLVPIIGLFFSTALGIWAVRDPVQLTAYTCPVNSTNGNEPDAYVTCTTLQKLCAVAWSLMFTMAVFWISKRAIADSEDIKGQRTNKKQEVALLIQPIAMLGFGVALYYGLTGYYGCRAGCISAGDAYCTRLIDAAGQIIRSQPKSCSDNSVPKADDWKFWVEE